MPEIKATDFLSVEDRERVEEIKSRIRHTYDPLLIEALQNEAMALIDKAAARFDEYLKKNLEGVR